jgi:hypothetical protein
MPTFAPSEFQEQALLALWLNFRKGILWTHVPNGELRNIVVARRLKACGVLPGTSDVLIFSPPPLRPEVAGVAIELKTAKGRLTSSRP